MPWFPNRGHSEKQYSQNAMAMGVRERESRQRVYGQWEHKAAGVLGNRCSGQQYQGQQERGTVGRGESSSFYMLFLLSFSKEQF